MKKNKIVNQHEQAWSRLTQFSEMGKLDALINSKSEMQHVANDVIADAKGIIDDIKAQREAILEPLKMPDLLYKDVAGIRKAYQNAVEEYRKAANKDLSNLDELQMKQANIAYYLSFRDGKALQKPLGSWTYKAKEKTAGARYSRVPGNCDSHLARILDFLYRYDRDLYAETWDTIADYLEKATAAAEKRVVSREYYSQRIENYNGLIWKMFNDGNSTRDTWTMKNRLGQVTVSWPKANDALTLFDYVVFLGLCTVMMRRHTAGTDTGTPIPLSEIFSVVAGNDIRMKTEYKRMLLDSCAKMRVTSTSFELSDTRYAAIGDLIKRNMMLLEYEEQTYKGHGKDVTCLVMHRLPVAYEIMQADRCFEYADVSIIEAVMKDRQFSFDLLCLQEHMYRAIGVTRRMRKNDTDDCVGYLSVPELCELHDTLRDAKSDVYERLKLSRATMRPMQRTSERSKKAVASARAVTGKFVRDTLQAFIDQGVIAGADALDGKGRVLYTLEPTPKPTEEENAEKANDSQETKEKDTKPKRGRRPTIAKWRYRL